MDLSISSFSSVSFCCMYFETLMLGAYTLKTVMSSWQIHFLSSLSLVISFSLKSP